MTERVKFRVQVGDLIIKGEADGTNLRETWRRSRDGTEITRLVVSLDARGKIHATVKRGAEKVRRYGGKS